MKNRHHITISQIHVDEKDSKQVEKHVESYCEAIEIPLPSSGGATVVETELSAASLLNDLRDISGDLRIFVQPRDQKKSWYCHPESFEERIEKVVDRSDAALTAVEVRAIFEND